MTFHSDLSTSLSSVATSLQHLHMEFSYHTSYIMPELAVTTQTSHIALDFLQLGFWNRVMFLQDWSHHKRSIVVVIINSWIITMYPSAPWKLICSTCQFSFPLSSNPDLTFYEQLGGCFMKNIGRLPYRCTWCMLPVLSGVRVSHLHLLFCMYNFVTSCSLLCLFFMSGLCPWITFFLFFISAGILVPLTTLPLCSFFTVLLVNCFISTNVKTKTL